MKLALLLLGVPATAAMIGEVGTVKDEYGCIPSAGYTWCSSSQKCIRPWETDCATEVTAIPKKKTTTKAILIDNGGKLPPLVGGDSDSNGCLASAGYQWCPELSECVRYWESDANGATYAELCPEMMEAMQATARRTLLGGVKDENGCVPSAGYSWCESSAKCMRPWEEQCADVATTTTRAALKPVLIGGKSENDCCVTCGYTWCTELSTCVQTWNVDLTQCPSLALSLVASRGR